MVKQRKPRTTGSDLDYDVSHMFGWPYDHNTPAAKKLYKRTVNGLCIACGKASCECRSGHPDGPSWKNDPYVMKNFWKSNLTTE